MIEYIIYVRATRDQLRTALSRIPAVARGGGDVADAMMVRCGLAAKSRIHAAFVTKAAGGTDEAGDSWAPLSPRTIARRRNKTPPVLILRDTGLLLSSMSPGVSGGERGHAESVFRVLPGEVVVGTNRKGAVFHHSGTRRMPQRRLWPPPSRWPANWWRDIAEQARQGLVDITIQLIRGL